MKPDNAIRRGTSELPHYVIEKNATFTRPATITALEYWRAQKGSRTMPSRADISPAALRTVLPKIALVDVPAPGDRPTAFVIRLAGEAVLQVMGPLTGKPIDEILPPEISERWTACFEAARTSAEPIRVSSRVAYQQKTWLQSEVLLAPLGQDNNVVMLFAAMDTWPAD